MWRRSGTLTSDHSSNSNLNAQAHSLLAKLRSSNFIPSSNVSVLILTAAQAEPGSKRSPGPLTDLKTLDCGQLRHQRNSIFKAGGYCFRTPRGTTSFGNAGCKYQNIFDVPLSHEDRRLVTAIQTTERAKRCPQ